ncbi:hypothetical protein [Lactococcus lactis]|uniref:hypothetical protein n=1 Tax=Lactococcus lactis TaxID=1358 RepID=UPI00223A9F4D|nr:hypothetical protein [Lactococcus lactis]MCT0449651.1 hypothetical protein [Lactococcus lactis subsp. lactis]
MEKYTILQEKILNGEFKEAKKIIKNISEKEFEQFMMSQPYDTEREISFYFFLIELLGEKEEAKLHNLASAIMGFGLNWFPGAYNVSMRHLQKAIQLNPENIDYKQGMLLYHDIPDHLLSKEDAIKYAKQVLEVNPSVKVAQDIINRYE